jgi:hypothetical protein
MLIEEDLEKYLNCFAKAQEINGKSSVQQIDKILSVDEEGLRHGEIWRLGRSIKIAISLEDCSNEHFVALELIREQVSDKKLFAGFECKAPLLCTIS